LKLTSPPPEKKGKGSFLYASPSQRRRKVGLLSFAKGQHTESQIPVGGRSLIEYHSKKNRPVLTFQVPTIQKK